jgi:hypothetical protein
VSCSRAVLSSRPHSLYFSYSTPFRALTITNNYVCWWTMLQFYPSICLSKNQCESVIFVLGKFPSKTTRVRMGLPCSYYMIITNNYLVYIHSWCLVSWYFVSSNYEQYRGIQLTLQARKVMYTMWVYHVYPQCSECLAHSQAIALYASEFCESWK